MYKAYRIDADNEAFRDVISPCEGDWFKRACVGESVNERDNELSLPLYIALKTRINASSLGNDDELCAESIWDEWFPACKADVFISHSSKDIKLAKQFSIWLKEEFGLDGFIDSDIWGHADKLLQDIDDMYCKNTNGLTYSYKKRNASTAHVHMILSYALTRMIDKTECFIFLDTSNSVTAGDAVDGTYSPWIFHELATVDTIEERQPPREQKKTEPLLEKFSSRDVKISYRILGRRLVCIKPDLLKTWSTRKRDLSPSHSLDLLYNLAPRAKME